MLPKYIIEKSSEVYILNCQIGEISFQLSIFFCILELYKVCIIFKHIIKNEKKEVFGKRVCGRVKAIEFCKLASSKAKCFHQREELTAEAYLQRMAAL